MLFRFSSYHGWQELQAIVIDAYVCFLRFFLNYKSLLYSSLFFWRHFFLTQKTTPAPALEVWVVLMTSYYVIYEATKDRKTVLVLPKPSSAGTSIIKLPYNELKINTKYIKNIGLRFSQSQQIG